MTAQRQPDELADLAQLPAPVPPPPSAQLETELATLAPVAPRRPVRQLVVLVGISLIYGGAMLALSATRHELAELPRAWLVIGGLIWLCGFVAPIYLATVPAAGAIMPRWRLAGIASLLGSLGFIGLGVVLHPRAPTSQMLGWDNFVQGFGCLQWGLLTALMPVVIGAIFLRRTLPVGSRWVAAGLGAGGGSLGGLVLHLHCSTVDVPHVAVMHGGVVGLAALLAAAVVPRTTDVR